MPSRAHTIKVIVDHKVALSTCRWSERKERRDQTILRKKRLGWRCIAVGLFLSALLARGLAAFLGSLAGYLLRGGLLLACDLLGALRGLLLDHLGFRALANGGLGTSFNGSCFRCMEEEGKVRQRLLWATFPSRGFALRALCTASRAGLVFWPLFLYTRGAAGKRRSIRRTRLPEPVHARGVLWDAVRGS